MTPVKRDDKVVELTRTSIDNIAIKKLNEWLKYIPIFITIISLSVGAAVWASSAHDSIKSWTLDENSAIKTELKATMQEQYVPLHEFTRVQQCLEDQQNNLEKIENKLDKILDKLATHPTKQR
jgi:Tfp pilus assembly protein PilO